MEPGPEVGVMLEVLLEKVTDGELENSKAVLMAEAERILSADHETVCLLSKLKTDKHRSQQEINGAEED